MNKQKVTKSITLVIAVLSSVALLGSSAIGIWQLAQAPLPILLPSNDSQAETQANSALEILRTKPEDENANKSLRLALEFYSNRGNTDKLIQFLEKHQQVAPTAPNASQYRKILARLKTPASSSSTPSPQATKQPATGKEKPSGK
jgi:hypothetical protein